MAMRPVLAELVADFRRENGSVDLVAAGGVDVARRIREGEAFDVVVMADDAIASLIASGHVVAATRTPLARSEMAIAVAANAAPRGFDDEAQVREAVANARTVGYSTGPSGAHVLALVQRWGLTDALAPRLRQATPGISVGKLVADGQAEIGFQQYSELAGVAGIDVYRLPAAIQKASLFAGAVTAVSQCAARASRLLAFLGSDHAAATKSRLGMAPARPGD